MHCFLLLLFFTQNAMHIHMQPAHLMYVCMYACVDVCKYGICLYMPWHVHTCGPLTIMYACHRYVCILQYTCTCVRVCRYYCTFMCVQCRSMYTHAVYACIMQYMRVCMHIPVHACVYVYTCTYMCVRYADVLHVYT